jgi:hypothetical protein
MICSAPNGRKTNYSAGCSASACPPPLANLLRTRNSLFKNAGQPAHADLRCCSEKRTYLGRNRSLSDCRLHVFVDRQERKTYQAYVALDGKGPFARTDSPSNGPNAVVLYRKGRNGVVCFDFFHSKELHDYLSPRNGLLVTVQYDTFSDFGKVRGYNVHSVDGMILANGYHVLREDFAVSSGMTSGSALNTKMFTLNGNDCW